MLLTFSCLSQLRRIFQDFNTEAISPYHFTCTGNPLHSPYQSLIAQPTNLLQILPIFFGKCLKNSSSIFNKYLLAKGGIELESLEIFSVLIGNAKYDSLPFTAHTECQQKYEKTCKSLGISKERKGCFRNPFIVIGGLAHTRHHGPVPAQIHNVKSSPLFKALEGYTTLAQEQRQLNSCNIPVSADCLLCSSLSQRVYQAALLELLRSAETAIYPRPKCNSGTRERAVSPWELRSKRRFERIWACGLDMRNGSLTSVKGAWMRNVSTREQKPRSKSTYVIDDTWNGLENVEGSINEHFTDFWNNIRASCQVCHHRGHHQGDCLASLLKHHQEFHPGQYRCAKTD
ncbi:hypothetical protein VP01_6645g1 [Puccinia sorghi]|uniref:Uncharacterized protein n=1 Tax=Puccinia sorghi TaxID=27349 RepID=A0A0L6UFV2_9BASI|nr:hypothetical protein VP01_6645g1 [Puccinia sorghi]